jgi:hypothetical protein
MVRSFEISPRIVLRGARLSPAARRRRLLRRERNPEGFLRPGAEVARSTANRFTDQRKPTFIDTSSVFCLDLLERTAHDADTVALTEVLPAHDQAWQIDDGNDHVTELQVEMCISSIPSSSAVA